MTIRVLHVDDNADDAELFRFQMNRLDPDIEITWVENGKKALEALGSSNWSCVISDYQMPKMDGLQLLAKVRERGYHLPFVFLTGQGNEELAAQALREGADDYYSKSIGFAHYERLINSIKRLIAGQLEHKKRREIERRIIQMTETVGDIIVIHDLQGKVTYANSATEKVMQLSRDEIVGSSVMDFVPEKYHEDLMKRSELRREGEEQRINYDIEIIAADGSHIPVNANSSMLYRENEPAEIIIVARDLRSRREVERQLDQFRTSFKTIFRLSPVGQFISSLDGHVLETNEAGARLFDEDPDALRGFSLLTTERLDEQARSGLSQILREALEHGNAGPVIVSGKLDKRPRHVELSVALIKLEGREVLLGSFNDVTDRIMNERRLRESEKRYRALFESANDAILIMNEVNFLDCNDTALKIFNASRNELLNNPPWKFSPERQPNGKLSTEYARELIDAGMRGERPRFYWQHTTMDGEPFDCDITLTVTEVDDETMLFVIIRPVDED